MSQATPTGESDRRLRLEKFIGSVAGIGYFGKGGGTLAAAVAALPLLLATNSEAIRWIWLPVATVVLTILGIWSGNAVEVDWGKDSSKVVLDEVVGMYVAILFHPINWSTVLAALVLFRIFDIWKPLGIRRTETLPGGWGVMVDDVVAGVYASLVLVALEWICKL